MLYRYSNGDYLSSQHALKSFSPTNSLIGIPSRAHRFPSEGNIEKLYGKTVPECAIAITHPGALDATIADSAQLLDQRNGGTYYSADPETYDLFAEIARSKTGYLKVYHDAVARLYRSLCNSSKTIGILFLDEETLSIREAPGQQVDDTVWTIPTLPNAGQAAPSLRYGGIGYLHPGKLLQSLAEAGLKKVYVSGELAYRPNARSGCLSGTTRLILDQGIDAIGIREAILPREAPPFQIQGYQDVLAALYQNTVSLDEVIAETH